MNTETQKEQELKRICTRIAWKVNAIDAPPVSAEEIELRDRLRAQVGRDWDAINEVWTELEAD